MLVPASAITDLLPHRPPFIMIGELLFSDETHTRTRTRIESGNVLVEDGFFTEAGLAENMAQTAAAGAGYRARRAGEPVKDGYIGAIKSLLVNELPAVNEIIETEISIDHHVFDITVVSGKITRDGKLLASCEMKIFTAQ